jgi:hypothetical protein
MCQESVCASTEKEIECSRVVQVDNEENIMCSACETTPANNDKTSTATTTGTTTATTTTTSTTTNTHDAAWFYHQH